jgi:AraC-like DNA-binding protein
MLQSTDYLCDRSRYLMDPLSDVLSLLRVTGYMSGGFDASGDWSIQFPKHEGIKFHAVFSGQCWLSIEGLAEPVQIRAGDCFLLPSGRPFCVASNLSLTPIDFTAIQSSKRDGGIISYNGGGEYFSIGGYFHLADNHASVLLGVLPPIVLIRKEADKKVLHWCLERMRQELREPQPGGAIVAQQLATMVLVQVLRLHLADGLKNEANWLFALGDRQMAAAINAMHNDPAHRWTLQLLAEQSGMSRTIFTLKFRKTVGSSPMEYLTRWRMLLGANRLADSGESISEIALSLGYESESAFSTAFKRVIGCSPRQYSSAKKVNAKNADRESRVPLLVQ